VPGESINATIKTFRIKLSFTGLETNPGIRVEMPDTEGLRHGTATEGTWHLVYVTISAMARQTAVLAHADSRYAAELARLFIGRREFHECT
jgi:hypothetical protein